MVGTYNTFFRNIKRKGKVIFDHSTTLLPSSLFLFISESSGFEIEAYPLTEMLSEVGSETVLQGHLSQVTSVMSNIANQASSPVGDELAKNMDSLQVTIVAFVLFLLIDPQ